MKEVVVVCRKWKNPEIKAFVSHEEVGAQMSVTQFLQSVAQEVGNPALLMTTAGLETKLQAAAAKVLEEMKRSTAKVVG